MAIQPSQVDPFATEVRMLRSLTVIGALVVFTAPRVLRAQHHSPDSARVVTTDLEHFWRAYDRAAQAHSYRDTLRAYFEDYYLVASPGLRDFIRSSIGSEYDLMDVIQQHPGYYRAMRPTMARLAAAAADVRRVFQRWREIYPNAVFPDVYLLVGRMNSGGRTRPDKILIGAEMYGRTAATPDSELDTWLRAVTRGPDSLAFIIAHELIHVNQRPAQTPLNLLGAAIHEGSADFLGALISGGNINGHLEPWAAPRERELWLEFRAAMHGRDYSRWLYEGAASGADRPADLGYYVGYRIAQAYYERAADKTKAIADILGVTDFDAFLAASGYAERFPVP